MGNITSLQEQCSTGKSGSFFYYTSCGRFLIKTIGRSEFKFFKSILPDYYRHLSEHPHSLLLRVFGLHKLKQVKTKVYFAVISNVFNTEREIHARYDIKGSSVDRRVRTHPGAAVYFFVCVITEEKSALVGIQE